MSVELKLYKRPELKTDVKPGQIIEALPGAQATETMWLSERIENSPTNVFGYVRGDVRESTLGEPQGETLVESLVPFGKPHMGRVDQINNELKTWSSGDIAAYFVIGELANVQSGYEDIFSPNLMDGSVTLSPEQIDVVRNQLLGFMKERGKKDYMFQTPDGDSYPLQKVVFSLQEIKED